MIEKAQTSETVREEVEKKSKKNRCKEHCFEERRRKPLGTVFDRCVLEMFRIVSRMGGKSSYKGFLGLLLEVVKK